jgi:hypothetical protein
MTVAEMRDDAAKFLAKLGCEITCSFSGRDGGSYSVGRIGENACFLPTTWPREEYVLDWVHAHREQVRRGVLGEPVEFHLFLEFALERAADRSGGNWHLFVAAVGNDLDQVRREASEATDDEVLDLLDAIEEMSGGSPDDVLERTRSALCLSSSPPRT